MTIYIYEKNFWIVRRRLNCLKFPPWVTSLFSWEYYIYMKKNFFYDKWILLCIFLFWGLCSSKFSILSHDNDDDDGSMRVAEQVKSWELSFRFQLTYHRIIFSRFTEFLLYFWSLNLIASYDLMMKMKFLSKKKDHFLKKISVRWDGEPQTTTNNENAFFWVNDPFFFNQ